MKQFKLLAIFILMLFANLLTSQQVFDQAIILDNNVRILNSYEMLLKDGEIYDSLLMETYIFNKKAKLLVDQTVYDDYKVRYESKYSADTFLVETKMIADDTLSKTTIFLRNEKNQIVRTSNINSKGDTMSNYSTYKYYNNGKLKELKQTYKNGIGYHALYSYYDNGILKTEKIKQGAKGCIKYDKKGNILKNRRKGFKWISDSYSFYENGVPKIYISKFMHKNDAFNSNSNKLFVNKGDLQSNIFSYHENGMIKFRRQMINHNILSVYHFHYITY